MHSSSQDGSLTVSLPIPALDCGAVDVVALQLPADGVAAASTMLASTVLPLLPADAAQELHRVSDSPEASLSSCKPCCVSTSCCTHHHTLVSKGFLEMINLLHTLLHGEGFYVKGFFWERRS